MVIWFTGPSGAGKTTIANLAEVMLTFSDWQTPVIVLDGDKLREGLNSNLGFSPEDRKENVRRVAEVASLFANKHFCVFVATISPYASDRKMCRDICEKHGHLFFEVYVDCPLSERERRDPKGLYKKAKNGELKGFTGVDAPYEKPTAPDLVIPTNEVSPWQAYNLLLKLILDNQKASI